MDTLLEKLENRISTMMEKLEQLQRDQQHLVNEKKLLQEKHESAIAQVERMIARLKPLASEEEACS